MGWTLPWWRRRSAALAAVVLTALTFAPGLEVLICHDEGSLSVAAAEVRAGDLASDEAPAGHVDDGAHACIHGHCHHPAPYVPATLVAAHAPSATLGRHEPPRGVAPISDLQFELRRPPRA